MMLDSASNINWTIFCWLAYRGMTKIVDILQKTYSNAFSGSDSIQSFIVSIILHKWQRYCDKGTSVFEFR